MRRNEHKTGVGAIQGRPNLLFPCSVVRNGVVGDEQVDAVGRQRAADLTDEDFVLGEMRSEHEQRLGRSHRGRGRGARADRSSPGAARLRRREQARIFARRSRCPSWPRQSRAICQTRGYREQTRHGARGCPPGSLKNDRRSAGSVPLDRVCSAMRFLGLEKAVNRDHCSTGRRSGRTPPRGTGAVQNLDFE